MACEDEPKLVRTGGERDEVDVSKGVFAHIGVFVAESQTCGLRVNLILKDIFC